MVTNNDKVEVVLSSSTLKWYRDKGYTIPTHVVQLWATVKGERVKNGKKERVASGTKLLVAIDDLPPSSNTLLTRVCNECDGVFTTTYQNYKAKHLSDRCSPCAKKVIKNEGSNRYWKNLLIKNNPDAVCDISGETDKRFLVLHHLLSRSNGGKNGKDNYVILTANYHMAFHNSWMGSTSSPCTPEDYYEFKRNEVPK